MESGAAQARAEAQKEAAELQHRLDELASRLAQRTARRSSSRPACARRRRPGGRGAGALRETRRPRAAQLQEHFRQEGCSPRSSRRSSTRPAGQRELAVRAASSQVQQEVMAERRCRALVKKLPDPEPPASQSRRVSSHACASRPSSAMRDDARRRSREQAVRESERQQVQAAHELELEQARKANAELVRYKGRGDRAPARHEGAPVHQDGGRDARAALSTEFNRLRMTAFPRAYFEKDNDASEGTKGTSSSVSATRTATRSSPSCSR